jgi:hypothetical protein
MQIDIRPGRVIFPNGSTGTSLLVANSITLCPIDLPVPLSINRLVLNVATAASGATTGGVNPEVGLYLADPGGRVFRNILRASLPAADLTTVGNKNVDLPEPFSLPRGRIWQAIFNPTYATTQPTLRAILSNSHASQDIDSLADGAALTSQSRVVRVLSISAGCSTELETATFTFVDNLSLPFLGMRVDAANIAPRVNRDLGAAGPSVAAVATPGAIAFPDGGVAQRAPGLTTLPTAFPTTPGGLPT